jgi:hypothetical protein
MRAYLSKTRAAGGSIKPGVERNPKMTKGKKTERAKRAIAQKLRFTHDEWLPPTLRALPLYSNDLFTNLFRGSHIKSSVVSVRL